MSKKVIVKINCRKCYQEQSLEVVYQDLMDWKSGKLIQFAMPYLNEIERELLISQTCGPCFDKMYPPYQEEHDNVLRDNDMNVVYCGDCLVPITECSHKGEVKC